MLVIFYLSHVALVKVLRHFAKISQTLSEFKSVIMGDFQGSYPV